MSLEFLEALEERVRATVERLEALSADNEELRSRIVELEAELAAARSSSATAWRKERNEIKKRVGKLVDKLSSLADSDGPGAGDPLV